LKICICLTYGRISSLDGTILLNSMSYVDMIDESEACEDSVTVETHSFLLSDSVVVVVATVVVVSFGHGDQTRGRALGDYIQAVSRLCLLMRACYKRCRELGKYFWFNNLGDGSDCLDRQTLLSLLIFQAHKAIPCVTATLFPCKCCNLFA